MKKVIVLGAALMSLSVSVLAAAPDDKWVDVENPFKPGEIINTHHEGTLNAAKWYMDGGLSRVNSRIDDLEKHAYAGVAGAAAMANIPEIQGYKTTIGLGTASFKGEQAVAAGISHAFTDNFKAKISTSLTGHDVMVAGGVGLGF